MDRTSNVLTLAYASCVPTKPKKPPKITEFDRLVRWRFEELVALGLAADEAISLIEIPDVVHDARNLVARGCPPALVASLLGD